MFALLAVSLTIYPLMRWYGRRVERAGGETVEKVHRIRRLLLVVSILLWLVAIGLVIVEFPLDRKVFGDAVLVVDVVGVLVLVIGSAIAAYRGLRPSYERLRGIEGTASGGSGRMVRLLVVLLAAQLAWPAFVLFVAFRTDWHPGVTIVGLLVFLVLAGMSAPLIIRSGMSTREPTASERERLQRMVDSHDVRIRGIRVLDTRHDPTASALFAGFGPGPKHVFVTDKLLENFDDEELAAVIAHEIGHRKKHHILIKLMTPIASLIVLAVVAALLIMLNVPPAPVLIALPLAIVASLILVQGTVAVALEKQADDYASTTVGPIQMRAALEKLAEFNMLKRRTGWLWNVITQHPGLDHRISRLEAHESLS